MPLSPYFLVALGGAFGAVLRFAFGRWTLTAFGPGFPWGTLGVNLIGGLCMGLLAGWLAARDAGGEPWRLLLGVGMLGGFTTFSAFSLDAVNLLTRGQAVLALGYVLASVLGACLALYAGLQIARAL